MLRASIWIQIVIGSVLILRPGSHLRLSDQVQTLDSLGGIGREAFWCWASTTLSESSPPTPRTQHCSCAAGPGLGSPLPSVYLGNVSSPSRGSETCSPWTAFLEDSLGATRSSKGESQKSFREDRSLLFYEKSCCEQLRAALGASDNTLCNFSMG